MRYGGGGGQHKEKVGLQVCWADTPPLGGGCPYTAKALGQLCPAFLSPPPISFPQMTSLFTGTAEASYTLLCTSTQSLPGPPFSIHLPSLLLIVTFLWWWW